MASERVKFYDLVVEPGRTFYSANTWKTRLSLLHKNVPFDVIEVTPMMLQSDEFRQRTGSARPLVPMVEFARDDMVFNSFVIADRLERDYADSSSLYIPEQDTSDCHPAAYASARAAARVFERGLGDSDPGWSTFFELIYTDLARAYKHLPVDYEYVTSDRKLGFANAHAKLSALNMNELIERARMSLLPFEALLTDNLPNGGKASFITSPTKAGFTDYVLFGRYMMVATLNADKAELVFSAHPAVSDWVERMLDLYDGHAKHILDTRK
ncbi:uncharacterized protein L969DRAFT_95075 [Mixia osmundae IAM 14324]|uniref:GST N-terminal domain-containing protein n=1 Tax=Mixia osmundae (strain CBS 9802 / IAM 14324 / JCM 22182 / KY 12970) TaxID=764103 RepID=G7E7E2_MIXOS|nr:uncharacterized protein L969DRAFT_95075 [Mixia osmundae IAM 14324]KEI38911.1 hypothetical protein L969DRAFT_95075 [Mixia osmundae IAM 14324]GAA98752.1 hypothetical protein E5Q_05440 [Mixia osmundae IAM 14324]